MSDVTTEARAAIAEGRTALGIELGSTRIKAVLIGPDYAPLAVGSHDWENQFVDRLWTYPLEAVWSGIQECYAALAADARQRYDVELTSVGALGVSAMMHGYLALDSDGELLTPFRTWRNTNTGEAAEQLSALFGYNIPHRWSVAHLFQADPERRRSRPRHRVPDHAGRLRSLAAHRGEGARHRRRQRHVPDRHRHRRLRRHDAGTSSTNSPPNPESNCGWPICCPRSGRPASRPASSPNRARSCSTRPDGCGPAS